MNKADKSYLAISCYFLLLLLLIIYRVTIGVDFSDESYYATFIDSWLKVGISHSSNLMLHQTAAWLVYPFASFYYWLTGGNTGIILFLRFLYVALSFLAMFCFFCLSKRIVPVFIAALVSGTVFLFIPWSLPTVSYNTIGMLGLITALCLFAIVVLDLEKSTHRPALYGSCFFWSLAIIAYPTLIIALFLFLMMTFFCLSSPKERRLLLRYILCGMICLSLLSILLLFTFGIQHLIAMLTFTNAANHVSDGFSRKWTQIQFFLFNNKHFFTLCVAALTLGIAKTIFYKKQFINWCSYLFLGSVIYFCLFCSNTVLFISHDFIFIFALAGIYIPLQTIFYRTYPPIIAVLYSTSLFAGVITTATAHNHLYNFHLGGFLAASLGLLLLTHDLFQQKWRYCVLTFALLIGTNWIMLASDYHYFYGEESNPLLSPSVRLTNSVYAGLRTSSQKANRVYSIQQLLPQSIFDKSVVVFDRFSDAYLLTSLSSKTLITWDWRILEGDTAENMISAFYQVKNNQPDFIFRVTDSWSAPLTPSEKFLIANYHLIKETKSPQLLLQLYARNAFNTDNDPA